MNKVWFMVIVLMVAGVVLFAQNSASNAQTPSSSDLEAGQVSSPRQIGAAPFSGSNPDQIRKQQEELQKQTDTTKEHQTSINQEFPGNTGNGVPSTPQGLSGASKNNPGNIPTTQNMPNPPPATNPPSITTQYPAANVSNSGTQPAQSAPSSDQNTNSNQTTISDSAVQGQTTDNINQKPNQKQEDQGFVRGY